MTVEKNTCTNGVYTSIRSAVDDATMFMERPSLYFIGQEDPAWTEFSHCPKSPSSQLMYERDALDVDVLQSPCTSTLSENVISPSVESMKLGDAPGSLWTDCESTSLEADRDMMQLCLQKEELHQGYQSQLTLTQLNSDDLESNTLDPFDISSLTCGDRWSVESVAHSSSVENKSSLKQLLQHCTTAAAVTVQNRKTSVLSSRTTSNNTQTWTLPGFHTTNSVKRLKSEPERHLAAPESTRDSLSSDYNDTKFPRSSSTTCLAQGCGVVDQFVQPAKREERAAKQETGIKRTCTFDEESSKSSSNFEKKWEEILHFVDGDENRVVNTDDTAQCSYAFPTIDVRQIKKEVVDESDDDNSQSATESIASSSTSTQESSQASSKKEDRYFWQYNTQCKGPKGKRLCKFIDPSDPHVLVNFEDPVFDPEQSQTRYKHSGKARRGDGNDISPNPYKLYQTGKELRLLNDVISGIIPPSEVPSSLRTKTLKEKNKFASRACRLKKKAQHEANKLKLYGLEQEHRELMTVIQSIKQEISKKLNGHSDDKLVPKLEGLIKQHLTLMIAGHTADYVNSILEKVTAGDPTGGLEDLR